MPPRPVPLWRLLLAWFALVAGVAGFWSAGPSLDTVGGLYAFVAAWLVTSKAASLLCLRADEFHRLSWGRLIAYLIFPGTQPRHFLPERKPSAQDVRPTILGVVLNFGAGALFLWAIPFLLPQQTPWLARAWIGMIGLSFLFLFVRFDVAVLIFRWLGFGVEKCWHCPVAATSVAEFWGFRWNRIMSGLLRDVLFVPLARRIGAGLAMLAVFFYSGLLHETCSFTVNAGYGGPTLYFLIQAAGVWLE